MAEKDSPASVPTSSKRSNGRTRRPIDGMRRLLNPDFLIGSFNPPLNNPIARNHNAEADHQETEDQETEVILPLKKRQSMRTIHPQFENLEVEVIRPKIENLEIEDPQVKVIRSKFENLEVGLIRQLDDPEVLRRSHGSRMTRSMIRAGVDNDRHIRGRLTRSKTRTFIQSAEAVGIPMKLATDDNNGEDSSSSKKRKLVNQILKSQHFN